MENREIKFRAWDKKNEVMINVLEIRFLFEDEKGLYVEGYCDCNHGAIQDHENHKHPIFPKNLELMQYTGIKDRKDDKNNKEIYEGDIVEKFGKKWKVVWGNVRCQFFCLSLDDNNTWTELGFDYVKVLGNIYENPELLK
jgi:uncharacterized phage protein (TIGR01671 family)